jgi:hypothetical protein
LSGIEIMVDHTIETIRDLFDESRPTLKCIIDTRLNTELTKCAEHGNLLELGPQYM